MTEHTATIPEVDEVKEEKEMVEAPKLKPVKANIKVIVQQPKVEKVVTEKKPLTEGQKKAIQKMNAVRKAKNEEKKAILKAHHEAEEKARHDAVKEAEAKAKELSEKVTIQKVRGRKAGTKNPVKAGTSIAPPQPTHHEAVSQVATTPLSYVQYSILALRQRGYQVPDDISPYALKIMLSKLR